MDIYYTDTPSSSSTILLIAYSFRCQFDGVGPHDDRGPQWAHRRVGECGGGQDLNLARAQAIDKL
jgi:hypothetical protein